MSLLNESSFYHHHYHLHHHHYDNIVFGVGEGGMISNNEHAKSETELRSRLSGYEHLTQDVNGSAELE